MAEFIQVTFAHRDGHTVGIRAYLATWQQAADFRDPRCDRSRQSLLAYQVLPALRKRYPERSWGFITWDDFTVTPGPTFNALPHPRTSRSTSRTSSGHPIPATTFQEDPNCRCDDERPFIHCQPHDH